MVMFFLKDGWSSKKTWTPLEDGASPTSLPTHCLTSRFCRFTNEKYDIYKYKRKERIITFESSYHFCHPKEQLEQGVILLDASGKTIDEILGELSIKRKQFLKSFLSCRRGSGHQGWGAPGHQAEGGHPSSLLPGSEVQNVDDQPLYPQTRPY